MKARFVTKKFVLHYGRSVQLRATRTLGLVRLVRHASLFFRVCVYVSGSVEVSVRERARGCVDPRQSATLNAERAGLCHTHSRKRRETLLREVIPPAAVPAAAAAALAPFLTAGKKAVVNVTTISEHVYSLSGQGDLLARNSLAAVMLPTQSLSPPILAAV